jgi:4-amino-4-deoxy-L-arabinose transferase-like glycosyltransferase
MNSFLKQTLRNDGASMNSSRVIVLALVAVLFAHLASYAYMARLASQDPEAAAYPILASDSKNYTELADTLLERGMFGRAPEGGGAVEPERHWPPGYPAFLAGVKYVTGSFVPAVVIQVALALLAVFLIYLMARKFLPEAWALVPAALYGFDPTVVLANTVILSDGLFASLLVIAVYVALFSTRSEFVRWGIVGLLLGALALIRPIAQFLIPLAGLFLVIRMYLVHGRDMRGYAPVVTYLLGAALLVAPWLAWTHAKFGVYEISHVGASNLLWYNAQDFLAWKEMNAERSVPAILSSRYRDDPAYERVHAQLREELQEATPAGGDIQNYEAGVALRHILEDPLRYAYFHVVNTAPFFIGSSFAAYEQVVVQVRDNMGFYAPTALALVDGAKALARGDWAEVRSVALVALEMLWWLGVFLLALWGLWTKRNDVRVLMFGGLVAYFALLTGPVAIARYRIPALPFLLILAAVGAVAIVSRLWQRRILS